MIELKSVSGTLGAGSVRDVSFRLQNGKTYGVFSTRYADAVALCALMAGAQTPTGGTILVGGFDMHREAKQARRGIGFLPANLLPDDELTPLEYLMSVADARDLNYDKTVRYAHELLELADLADKKHRLIANLSNGEKRTLCLLQTLLGNPEILVLSSPLSGLLPRDAQKTRDLIAYLGETYTIFLCTPSIKDLAQTCDEIIVLQDGTLKTVAPADDEALTDALSAAPAEESPTPEDDAPQSNRTRALFKLLMQKGDTYEVIDTDGKESKN